MQKNILERLFPLHRTLVSEGTDTALEIIGEYMPPGSAYSVETYPPLEDAWTWKIPERYVVHEAYLEKENGERIADFSEHPLHLVSYSVSTDTWLSWDELTSHLFCSASRPHAIPWEFRFYQRDWGFCLSKDVFDALPHDIRYHAVIRSEFVTDPSRGLRVSTGVISPENGNSRDAGEILLCAHVCHPYQANDDLAGVVTCIEVARRLEQKRLPPGSPGVRFLFCPETIGSVCYLSRHEDLIKKLRAGIFCEMTGNKNTLILQRSLQDDHLIDRIARYVLKKKTKAFREDTFREVIVNDEMVINGPGVGVPCISLSRWPYDEYHTSDDSPDIIDESMLQEAADVVEEILRIYAHNYTPVRKFKGPVFLSRFGLWIDWRENPSLNKAIDNIMIRFEGDHTIFDIAEDLNLDFWEVLSYVDKFLKNDLIRKDCLKHD